MCGLAGYWNREMAGAGDALDALAARMADTLAHRGPDGQGTWIDPAAGFALGHRRLAVIDPSPRGAQPMASADGRHVLVFNGAIYNHLEVRRDLESRGRIAWRGRSDTETVAEAVAALGFQGALEAFAGMFALAAWDRRERVLRLAVDRMGEKPLYHAVRGGAFAFASEPQAFRELPGEAPPIARESLALLLRFGSIPAPRTIWEGVEKLEPGTFLEVREKGSGFSRRAGRHWDLRAVARRAFANRFRGDVREAKDELELRLRAAVARQTLADVPLGVFLSGGVDSSTVAALLQAQSAARVRTFTIGFDSPEYDEGAHARRVATHLGTDHVEERLGWDTALNLIPRLPETWCEPFADASQIPALLVARMARRHVTVCLGGDGGDELFAGYNRHVREKTLGPWLDATPRPLRRLMASGLRTLGPASMKAGKQAAALEAEGPTGRYAALVSRWRNPAAVLPGVIEPPGFLEDSAGWEWCADPVERMQLLDLSTYLPSDILTKVDRACMGVGLEARAPFLDADLVAFALSLPPDLRIRDGQGKWILRQVLHRHVPAALVERPKAGFAVPLAEWLRGPLREWAGALLDPARIRREGWLEAATIQKAWSDHLSGRADRQEALWAVLMFQAWLERWAR